MQTDFRNFKTRKCQLKNVVELINRLELDSESINTWKARVARALKRYIPDGTEVDGHKCSNWVLTKSFIKKVA